MQARSTLLHTTRLDVPLPPFILGQVMVVGESCTMTGLIFLLDTLSMGTPAASSGGRAGVAMAGVGESAAGAVDMVGVVGVRTGDCNSEPDVMGGYEPARSGVGGWARVAGVGVKLGRGDTGSTGTPGRCCCCCGAEPERDRLLGSAAAGTTPDSLLLGGGGAGVSCRTSSGRDAPPGGVPGATMDSGGSGILGIVEYVVCVGDGRGASRTTCVWGRRHWQDS